MCTLLYQRDFRSLLAHACCLWLFYVLFVLFARDWALFWLMACSITRCLCILAMTDITTLGRRSRKNTTNPTQRLLIWCYKFSSSCCSQHILLTGKIKLHWNRRQCLCEAALCKCIWNWSRACKMTVLDIIFWYFRYLFLGFLCETHFATNLTNQS